AYDLETSLEFRRVLFRSKGTPASYIATYIGKNLDASAFHNNDPKTGKPYVDEESGKTMAETVENAIAWASLHRIRQFQFFGIPRSEERRAGTGGRRGRPD